ncbi:hypothetical protein [Niabella ginsengisoli]|uniref:Uncharacterized protein n=1 Tax=Niabella ginsengisoli TaxID=522298 RepID=A0ABS9SKU1_9BACT|nr:hypothetical protein [Niabella ginsengisoli]MCH5599003.1 hypothetical protein [Niabella ginsengisoli]
MAYRTVTAVSLTNGQQYSFSYKTGYTSANPCAINYRFILYSTDGTNSLLIGPALTTGGGGAIGTQVPQVVNAAGFAANHVTISGDFTFSLPTGNYYLGFVMQKGAGCGGASRDILNDDIVINTPCTLDTDGDGIFDFQDSDSDNDGCPDALEGGANLTTANLDANNRLTGTVGVNGAPAIAGNGQAVGSSQIAATSACDPVSYVTTVPVDGMPALTNLGANPLQGSDSASAVNQQSWVGRSIAITTLPTNGFILTYNGTAVTAGLRIDDYDPTLLTIEPSDATPTGTTSTTFQYAVFDASDVQSSASDYTLNFSIALPVNFGLVEATITGGELIVNWSSISETNNDHFEVDVSADGKTFTSIGKVDSKAENGNSSSELTYSFSKGVSGVVAGISVLLLMITPVARRYRKLLMAVFLFGITVYIISCNKQNKDVLDTSGDVYVRIAQVDKDGSTKYSKTVKANKE